MFIHVLWNVFSEIKTSYLILSYYEYHLEFSARAAYFKEHHNTLVDWGIVDDRLLT